MKLILLGTTGYHPNDRRHTACMLLPDLGVAFDAGTALYRVSRHLQSHELDVFLSHAHLDHCFGLTFLFDVRTERPDVGRITVHGEADKLAAIREHLFSELLFPVAPPFETRLLVDRVELAKGGIVTHFPLKHPGGAVGYRVDWPDRSLAYVTDTTASVDADYVRHIAGVDLLLHECYFDDGMTDQARLTGHSCLNPVAQVAAKAQVGRLVLVHLNPLLDNDDELDVRSARRVFPRLEVGFDGMELDF